MRPTEELRHHPGTTVPSLAIRGSRAPLTRVAASVAVAAGVGLLAPSAQAGPHGDAALIDAGLRRAVAVGRIGAPDADRYRASVRRAVGALPALGPPGRRELGAVLHGIARRSHRLTEPQALVLFSTLDVNARHLPRGVPAGAEVVGADGIVYRAFPGIGLRFHPLESFGRLNAHASSGRPLRAYRLAYALLARATREGGTLVWRYEFDASGQRAPWTSGMAQAVAAQALARVGLMRDARRAYHAIPAGHLLRLERGPWVRLYRASRIAVLNAQLQTAISVAEYGRRARDPHALRLARALSRTAAGLLPQFDTGYWSRYALGGNEAPLHYHRYVVSLLWKLARHTDRPVWRQYAARFRNDWRLPPRLRSLGRPRPVIPLPADGHRDRAAIRFWLSKPATVTLFVAGQRVTARLQPGRRSFDWRPRNRPPGRYHVRVVAVDRVGNRTDRDLPPVVVERDRTPPRIVLRRRGGRLVWKPVDAGSGWVEGCLVLRLGNVTLPRALGQVPRGLEVALPARMLHDRTTLVARDAAGNATTVPLADLEAGAGSFLRRPPTRARRAEPPSWSLTAALPACSAAAGG